MNDIFWVVTLPTCCWYSSRHMDFIQQCLEKAGMTHYAVCADSVAAAFHEHTKLKHSETPKLVIDCGASKIDVAYIESNANITSTSPKITMCDTLFCGAHTVGDAFVALLKQWFAEMPMTKLHCGNSNTMW
eukprot:CAMPEP_0202701850 /NCGR_PEP_ID=MMETSP1385-20130828/14900_1 /ASSEMBLY_ACC=CAM_ASM_000861 /TAXON_ID=933848 /ORGANISM="Elphidium margaritaceum" /LENGTH=130 /DNA_ID=CAMNT_0049359363 /DNA_START=26 /DNA_END=415 /DNA_ORIENTATION=+